MSLENLTAAECRERALSAMEAADDAFVEHQEPEAQKLRDVAQFWATMATTAPEHAAPVDPADDLQRLPGVQLFGAGSPEPDVNPGEVMVDPGGNGARFLLRLDGHLWLWCDSLAEAEASEFKDASTWDVAMGCGIIRVRRATERESIEFRNGTGGAALDLTRRLINALSERANAAGHAVVAQWLADCADRAYLAYHTQQWPTPPSAVPADSMLTVRVENPQPDLERLNHGTLSRLRDAVAAALAVRAPEPLPDERWRAGTGGGAAQWREG